MIWTILEMVTTSKSTRPQYPFQFTSVCALLLFSLGFLPLWNHFVPFTKWTIYDSSILTSLSNETWMYGCTSIYDFPINQSFHVCSSFIINYYIMRLKWWYFSTYNLPSLTWLGYCFLNKSIIECISASSHDSDLQRELMMPKQPPTWDGILTLQ